jgi:DNA-binding PadR family transcriptional regulator
MQRVKRYYTGKIFAVLAESHDPLSPFSIQKNWKSLLSKLGDNNEEEQARANPAYPRIYEAIKKLQIEGYIELKKADENGSEKHAKITYYGLTFKGALKYLAQFYEMCDDKSLSFQTEKLLSFIERQGALLNYPLFLECRWLYERDENVIRYFVSEAKGLLQHPLNIDANIAEEYSKYEEKRHSHNEIFGKDENLRSDFAEHYFVWGLSALDLKETDSNTRLSFFATEILYNALWKIGFLENAVKKFSGKLSFPQS